MRRWFTVREKGSTRLRASQRHRIDPELFGGLVEMGFDGEPGLRCAVTPLRPARGLVGEDSDSLESVGGDSVGRGLQLAGVHEAGGPVAAVAATVEVRREGHGSDVPVRGEPGANGHEHRVASPMGVEDPLPGERDLHGTAGGESQPGGGDLVGEDVGLRPKTTAYGRRNDPDLPGGHLEHAGQDAVQIVGDLGRGPYGEAPIATDGGHHRMRLQGCVGVALKEEVVLPNVFGSGKTFIDISELERRLAVHVGTEAFAVDQRARSVERLFDGRDVAKRLVLDVDQIQARSAVSASTAATAATGSPT